MTGAHSSPLEYYKALGSPAAKNQEISHGRIAPTPPCAHFARHPGGLHRVGSLGAGRRTAPGGASSLPSPHSNFVSSACDNQKAITRMHRRTSRHLSYYSECPSAIKSMLQQSICRSLGLLAQLGWTRLLIDRTNEQINYPDAQFDKSQPR